jgi:hypothetical protein
MGGDERRPRDVPDDRRVPGTGGGKPRGVPNYPPPPAGISPAADPGRDLEDDEQDEQDDD